MPQSFPDAVVIGAGLGGLSAAIHLKLAGHRVRIFEANPSTGGRANTLMIEGHRFDTGPTLLNYPWVFEELFQAAGVRMSDFVQLQAVEPTISYCWRDGERLTLSTNRDKLASELTRFEPSAAHKLDRFLADAAEKFRIAFCKLIPQNEQNALRYFASLSWRELLHTGLWRSMYAEIGRFFRSRYIREAFGSYAMYLGGSPFRLPGLFSILPYGELMHGLWYPQGGIYKLVEAIEKLARDLGVEIHTGQKVARILHSGGQVCAVKLASGERLPVRLVVCNADLPAAFPSLLEQPPPRLAMSPAVLTYYWVVRRRPSRLAHHTILLPGEYRAAFRHLLDGQGIPADPALYVASPPPESRAADEAPARLFVLAPLPVLSRLGAVRWPEAIAQIRQHALKRLAECGAPMAPEEILAERVWSPPDWADRFNLFDGSAFGAAHTLGQVGPFRSPNFSRGLRGLYFTGASTVPGTGLPMVVLSGKLTAQRIASDVR